MKTSLLLTIQICNTDVSIKRVYKFKFGWIQFVVFFGRLHIQKVIYRDRYTSFPLVCSFTYWKHICTYFCLYFGLTRGVSGWKSTIHMLSRILFYQFLSVKCVSVSNQVKLRCIGFFFYCLEIISLTNYQFHFDHIQCTYVSNRCHTQLSWLYGICLWSTKSMS